MAHSNALDNEEVGTMRLTTLNTLIDNFKAFLTFNQIPSDQDQSGVKV